MKNYITISLSYALLLASLNVDHCMAKSGKDVDLSSAISGNFSGVDAALCYGHMFINVAADDKPKLVVTYDLPGDIDVQASVEDNVFAIHPSRCNYDEVRRYGGYAYATLSLPVKDKLSYLVAGGSTYLNASTLLIDDKLKTRASGSGMVAIEVPKSITELDVEVDGSGKAYIYHEDGTSNGTLSKLQLTAGGSGRAFIDIESVVDDGSMSADSSGQLAVNARSFNKLETKSEASGTISMKTSETSKKLSATATTSGHSNMCGSLFSEVEVEVSTSGSLDVGVTSDAKVSGTAETSGHATFYGDASISGVTQTTGGSAHKGSKCKAMKPLPDFPLGLTESSGVMLSTSFSVTSTLFAMATVFMLA